MDQAPPKGSSSPLGAPSRVEVGQNETLPTALIAEILGAESPADRHFTDRLVAALERISPTLVPRRKAHPLAAEIAEGVAAYPRLLEALKTSTDPDEKALVLDALGEIVRWDHATAELLRALIETLASAQTPLVASLAARALAAAGHESFLEGQRAALASDRPSVVAAAARLVALGRYAPAVPDLLRLLRSDRLVTLDVVVEALGEIGAEEALPALHRMLFSGVESVAVATALGQIGAVSSLAVLLASLESGSRSFREADVLAVAKILRANDGELFDPELTAATRATLLRAVDRDESRLVRFYALVGLSVLGVRLAPNVILKALGARLGDTELDAFAKYHLTRGKNPSKIR